MVLEIYELYNAGFDKSLIAKTTGLPYDFVCYTLKEFYGY